MENMMFQGKGVDYWRAEIQSRGIRTFNDVVSFFQRQGLSKARAIIAARKAEPRRYNEFMAKLHRQTL